MAEYEEQYRELFRQHSLSNIFLVTPESSPGRIRKIDELTEGFIYALSSSSTTGKNMDATTRTDDYFRQLHEMKLRSEEHTSELQSLMRISYAVFCLKTKTQNI